MRDEEKSREKGTKEKETQGKTNEGNGRDETRRGWWRGECLKNVEARDGRERSKDREEARVARGVGFRRRYFHRDLDLGLDGPQTV